VRGNQARVKNAEVRHPSSTVVMHRRKSASPVHNVLIRTAFNDIPSKRVLTVSSPFNVIQDEKLDFVAWRCSRVIQMF